MPYLEVKLCDGRVERLQIPSNASSEEELRNFLEQRAGYDNRWIALQSGSHVRYDQIVEVKLVTT